MGDKGTLDVHVVAGADEFLGVVVVFRPNGLSFPSEMDGRAEERASPDLLGDLEVYFLGVHEIEITVPTPKMEALVVFAVVGGETAEFHVEFHGGLDDDEHEEVEFAGLVDEIEEFLVFALEIAVEVAGVEVNGALVEDDVELGIGAHFREIAEGAENGHKSVGMFEAFRRMGENVQKLVDGGEIGLFGKVDTEKFAEAFEIAGNMGFLEGMEFLRVGEEVEVLVVVVYVVEVVDKVAVGGDLEVGIPGVVIRGVDLQNFGRAEKVGGRIEGLSRAEFAERYEKAVLVLPGKVPVEGGGEDEEEGEDEEGGHGKKEKSPRRGLGTPARRPFEIGGLLGEERTEDGVHGDEERGEGHLEDRGDGFEREERSEGQGGGNRDVVHEEKELVGKETHDEEDDRDDEEDALVAFHEVPNVRKEKVYDDGGGDDSGVGKEAVLYFLEERDESHIYSEDEGLSMA